MRKVVLFGIVLLSVAAFSFMTVIPVERKILNPDGTTALAAAAKLSQVEVTNFPAVQPVNGTVNVGNLPLDGDGNVRVTVAPKEVHFVGITTSTFPRSGALPMSRGCNAEFSGTRLCDIKEVVRTIPTPDAWSQPVLWVGSGDALSPLCMDSEGSVFGVTSGCGGDNPVACCGS